MNYARVLVKLNNLRPKEFNDRIIKSKRLIEQNKVVEVINDEDENL